MSEQILKEIKLIQDILSSKLHKYQIEDEEESKEAYFIGSALVKLRQVLNSIVERVISQLEKQSQKRLFPLSKSSEQIQKVIIELQYMTAKWERQRDHFVSHQQRKEALQALSQLQEFVQDVRPNKRLQIRSDSLFLYNQDQITKQLLSSIRLLQKQDVLLDTRGLINVNTRQIINFKVKPQFPEHYASFFLEKLFICGGKNARGELSQLLSLDSFQQVAKLAPMAHKRRSLSLSGANDKLLAIGGYLSKYLSTVESYHIQQDKWTALPDLTISRMNPGSCVLSSDTAFCFAGFGDKPAELNSLQRLEPKGWSLMKLGINVAKYRSLGVVQLQDRMILFGGMHKPLMLEFSLDGVFLKDDSHLAQIPKQMGEGSFVVKDEIVYVSSGDPFKKWRVQVFKDEAWSSL